MKKREKSNAKAGQQNCECGAKKLHPARLVGISYLGREKRKREKVGEKTMQKSPAAKSDARKFEKGRIKA